MRRPLRLATATSVFGGKERNDVGVGSCHVCAGGEDHRRHHQSDQHQHSAAHVRENVNRPFGLPEAFPFRLEEVVLGESPRGGRRFRWNFPFAGSVQEAKERTTQCRCRLVEASIRKQK